MVGAAAHTRVPAVNSPIATRKARRPLVRASNRPTSTAATTEASRKIVVFQAYSRSPPISAIAEGSRLVVR